MRGRKEKLKSFEIIGKTVNPTTRYIPTNKAERVALYNEFAIKGIKLPEYNKFTRKALRKRDMMVLCSDWFCSFNYAGGFYQVTIKAGACVDGASVPKFLVKGDLNKFGQQIQEPALIHDALFALKLMSFEDSNNVFEAFIRTKMVSRFVISLYSFGVRTPIGKKIYNNSKPEKHWLYGFVTFNDEYK